MAKARKKSTVKAKTKAKVSAKAKTAKTAKKSSKVKAKAKAKKPSAAGKALPTSQVLVGQKVPSWRAAATGNKEVSSDSLKGRLVVLYFYPKDKTPGCTLEGHDFTKLHQGFLNANTEVFGISRDTVKLHESFKECENYSIDLLSDEDETLCNIFGVIKNKNMYGKIVRGIERSTFVIDAEGRLLKEWRGVKVPGHADEVLDYIKSIE